LAWPRVAVVVESPHEGHVHPVLVGEALADLRHAGGRGSFVARDTDDLGARQRELGHLPRRARRVRRVGVRHRLDDHRCAAPHLDVTDHAAHRATALAAHGVKPLPVSRPMSLLRAYTNRIARIARPTKEARSKLARGVGRPRTFSMIAKRMWPPSSGSSGIRFMIARIRLRIPMKRSTVVAPWFDASL